jgi:hypothetical protein
MDKIIEIKCFNPYKDIFRDRKLLTLESLQLIKYLRNEGYEVKVIPDDGSPAEYLFKKGVRDLFQNPIFITAFTISMSILSNLISNWIQKLIDKDKRLTNKNIHTENIIINTKEVNKYYQLDGKEITTRIKKLNNVNKSKDQFIIEKLNLISPFPEFPTPLFLEHKPKIVGWVLLNIDKNELRFKGIVTDKTTRKRINQKELRGASVTGIATKTECSICKSNYILCNHISGTIHDGIECVNLIVKADIIEISLVKEPINGKCLIDLK